MITSLQNPGVKEAVHLRERRARDKSGLFLIEGYRELLRAINGGVKLERLYTCEELFLGSNEGALIARASCTILPCKEGVFRKLSYRDRPDGLLAVAHQMDHKLTDLKVGKHSLFVVAEAIEKPGNLGTILRSADAVGADAVIVCDRCTDIHNPNVVRASTGTLFMRPVVEATSDEVLDFLQGVQILAATPEAKVSYTEADMKGPLAIVLGTEQLGLTDRWKEAATLKVSIPMKGEADSLNVAMATTVLLYEALRQRSQ